MKKSAKKLQSLLKNSLSNKNKAIPISNPIFPRIFEVEFALPRYWTSTKSGIRALSATRYQLLAMPTAITSIRTAIKKSPEYAKNIIDTPATILPKRI